MYGADGCVIRLEDGSTVSWWTFVWNADEPLLKEGTFDLENWLSKKQHPADDQTASMDVPLGGEKTPIIAWFLGPVEIGRPILLHRRGSDWRAGVDSLFRTIRDYCLIETNRSCGFHVHFALENGWEVNLLGPFCRAIFYFERAFEALFPAHRRGNEYAKSLVAENERLGNQAEETVKLDVFNAIQSNYYYNTKHKPNPITKNNQHR